jgi:hypothetical protein
LNAFKEILTGLMSVEIRDAEARKYAVWADKIGRARIEAIASGRHRGAYDRAARVLGALAKYYILANVTEKARSLLHEFIFVKFPRHHAFRREAKNTASGSALIRDLRVIQTASNRHYGSKTSHVRQRMITRHRSISLSNTD